MTGPDFISSTYANIRSRDREGSCIGDAWVTTACRWQGVAVEFSRKTALGKAHLLLTVRSIHGGSLPLFACAGAGDGSGSDSPAPLG